MVPGRPSLPRSSIFYPLSSIFLSSRSSIFYPRSSIFLSSVPIARIETAVIGAEGIADRCSSLEVAGIPPTAVGVLGCHGSAGAHRPIGVPGTGRHPQTRTEKAVAGLAASPGGCPLFSSDQQRQRQERGPEKSLHDDVLNSSL